MACWTVLSYLWLANGFAVHQKVGPRWKGGRLSAVQMAADPSCGFASFTEILDLLDKYRMKRSWRRDRSPDRSRRTVVYILRQLSNLAKGEDARNVLLYMLNSKDVSLAPDTLCLNTALRAMRYEGEKANELLREWSDWYKQGLVAYQADTVSYNTVLAAVSYNTQLAKEVFRDLLTYSQPDEVSYATLLRSHATKGNIEATRELLDELLDSEVDPSHACLDQILFAYSQAHQPDQALEFLNEWKQIAQGDASVPPPRTESYNIVLYAFCQHDLEQAGEFLGQMALRDPVSYTTYIGACCRLMSGEDALSRVPGLVAEANRYVHVDEVFLANVIFSLATIAGTPGVPQLAELLVATSIERDIRPDVTVYNALIHCWAKSGEPEAADRVGKILAELEKSKTPKPNIKTYVSVLDCLARSRRSLREAEALVYRMEQDRDTPRPNVQAYTSLIQNYSRSRSPHKAKQAYSILCRMKKQQGAETLPNVITFNAVLNAAEHTDPTDTGIREEALRIACETFDTVRRDNLTPNHVTYGTFLGCLGKLMPSNDERDEMVTLVFRKCAAEGMVSRLVLQKLQFATTPSRYQELLESRLPNDLPASWTCRVQDVKARHFAG